MQPPLIALVVAVSFAVAVPHGAASRARGARGVQSTVLLENARVRVLENVYPAGAVAPLHTHAWPRVVYVLQGGSLQLENDDGGAVRMDVAAGQTAWRPAETHVVRNVGRTQVHVIEVEIKMGDGDPPGR